MLNSKEAQAILVSIIVITITVSFLESLNFLAYALVSVFFVFLINVLAKKMMGYYLDSEIEMRFWTMERYGFKPKRYFKRKFPAWIIFPIVTAAITLGKFVWMSVLTFEVKPKVYRAAKRHGLYSFSEMTEAHIGYIAAAGVVANIIFGVLGYLIGYTEFARLNLYLAFFSMLPFSDLDGNKIFFGSLILWSFLAAVVLIGLGYAFFLI